MDAAGKIQENWQRVCDAVALAQEQTRGSPVQIVGVSKYVGPELTQLLVEAGCTMLGENRPQVLWEKHAYFEEIARPQPEWHVIGHLQRNKVRRTLPMVHCIHSVDSQRLATAIDTEASQLGKPMTILAEVNITADSTKTGMQEAALVPFLEHVSQLENVQLKGLMAMSTHFAGGDQARREFAHVRALRDRMAVQFPHLEWTELSMGMSGDFREAILEGATMVRIGSNLWDGVRE